MSKPSISIAPPDISFSRNQIQLQLMYADYVTASPVTAVNIVAVTGALTEGATVNLNWTGGAAMLTAKNAPDDSGTQFPAGDGSVSHVQSLVTWFRSNYFIDMDFLVTSTTYNGLPALKFIARTPGAAYNFSTYDIDPVSCSNQTLGTDAGYKDNLMMHLELWMYDPATGTNFKSYDANLPFDYPLTGTVTVDIADALHVFLGIDMPSLSDLGKTCKYSLTYYFLKYAVFYGTIPSIKAITTSASYYVARGGLSLQASLIRNINTEFYPVGGGIDDTRFMRQGSKNIIVTPEQPEWLTWLNLTGTTQNATLEARIVCTDGTETTHTITTESVNNYQKAQFQAGYNQLAIQTQVPGGKSIAYYTLRLKNQTDNLTAEYKYVLDYRRWEWSKFFIWENAYGAFQTLATVGKGQTEFDRTKDDAQLAIDQVAAANNGSFLECNILIQDKGTISIGYQRSTIRSNKLLRSFLASEHIFLFQDGSLLPVGINTTNIKDNADGDGIYANSIEYFFKYQESVYTDDPAQPDDTLGGLLGSGAGGSTSLTDDDFDEIYDSDDDYDYDFFDED